MRESIDRYNKEITKLKANISIVPLLTSKLNAVRAVYTLALRINENIAVLKKRKAKDYENIAEPYKNQMDNAYDMLVGSINAIRNAACKPDLVKILDDITVRVTVTMQGIIYMAPQFDMRFNTYGDIYDAANFAKDEVKNTLTEAYRHIVTNRQVLNILSSLPEYLDVRQCCIPAVLDSAEYFKESRVSPDIYIYAPSARSYNNITANSGSRYKKIITGDSIDATISTHFDMNVHASTFLYHFYHPAIDEADENFRKFFAFMNAHTCIGGVEIIGMPRIFLNYHIIEYLSGYLDNMHIVSQSRDARFTVVIGNRKNKYSRNADAAMNAMQEVLTSAESFTIGFTNHQADKISFRSAYPTAEEIASSFNNARAFIERMNNNINKSLALKTEEESRHPLLPFSPGQLGLVLVSGDVDGVIQENETYAHAIKGSTVRTPQSTTEYDAHGNRVTKVTHATTTSVVMLTGDGEFKDLI